MLCPRHNLQRGRKAFKGFLFVVILAVVSLSSYADTEQVIQYEYDNAGNMTGIRFGSQDGPPVITHFVPDVINPGNTFNFTAMGTNLVLTSISSDNPGLTVTNIESSDTQLHFAVRADITAQQGPAILTFTNRFGSAKEELFVLEPFIVSVTPNPVLLAADGQSRGFDLAFNRALTVDRMFRFSVVNEAIASVTTQTVKVFAGADSVEVRLSGHAEGLTALNIMSLGLVNEQVNLIVAPAFSGEGVNFALPVSIFVGEFDVIPGVDNPILSHSVSVNVGIDTVPDVDNPLLGANVPIAVGPVLQSISPGALTRGSRVDFIVTGAELQGVTAVMVVPSTGVTVDSFIVDPSGRRLTISLTASGSARRSTRSLRIENADGEVPASTGTRLPIEVE